MKKLKFLWKQFWCRHLNGELLGWHKIHELGSVEPQIEAKYKCLNCGKIEYLYLFGKEASEWLQFMETFKMCSFDPKED